MTEGVATLDELLSDPMVRLVMARDGVRPEELRSMLERVRERAQRRPFVPAPHVIAQERQAYSLCR